MNYRFSQDSDFKILRFPQIPSSSASAFVSAEIFEDFKIFPRFCSASLLKICPISRFSCQDFPKILPKIFKIPDCFEDMNADILSDKDSRVFRNYCSPVTIHPNTIHFTVHT
jgi:hypothetical protein